MIETGEERRAGMYSDRIHIQIKIQMSTKEQEKG